MYADYYISTYARLSQPALGMWIVIFLPLPAVTTCAGYTEGYIFTYASCAGGPKCSFVLLMPAVTSCARFASTYDSCDDRAGYAECYISTCARL